MLSPDDRRAIEGLFKRLEEVERTGPERDPEAEALIQDGIRQAPGAPYYMAQTILVQEQALNMAEQRIAELEDQLSRRQTGGGLFEGLFGGGQRTRQGTAPQGVGRQQPNQAPRGPWGSEEPYGGRPSGGGFLAGAAQTALGVTGGVLLGSAIAGMMSGGAEASEADQPADAPAEGEEGYGEDDGGDAGGDFDVGGDF